MKRKYDAFEQLVAEVVEANIVELKQLKIGDKVTRLLSGYIPMPLLVTAVDDQFIHCGEWKFDKKTGAEVDELLGWDNQFSGSYLDI